LSENYIATYYRLKKVLNSDNVTIKNAIFELDMHTFSEGFMKNSGTLTNLNLFAKYIPLSEIRKIRSNDSLAQILMEIYLPVLGQGPSLRSIFVKNTAEFQNGGGGIVEGDFTKSDINLSLVKNYESMYYNYKRIDNLELNYFLKTISLAKEKNINVIFIKYPISKELDQYLSLKNITKDDYYNEVYKQINLTIGKNYTVLDYYYLIENSSNFWDPDHLNINGSEILSKKINLDLNNIEYCKNKTCIKT
jgi:hypothetical protein